MLWNFDWFPLFLITVRRGRRGGGVPYFPTLNFKTHHFVYFTITEEAMLLLVLFYILFVLFFVTVVAVSRPCRLLEFYLNRASTSHGIALFYIRNYSPPTNLSLELSPSLHSWWDSGAWGTFSATTQSEAIGGAARESTLTLYPLSLGLRHQNNTALPR